MPKLITATDMIRSFSDVVSRVYYKGESFDIKKGNNIVARLSPAKAKAAMDISDLNNFFKSCPHLEANDTEDFKKILDEARSLKDSGGVDEWE